jgi:hypothetical protein
MPSTTDVYLWVPNLIGTHWTLVLRFAMVLMRAFFQDMFVLCCSGYSSNTDAQTGSSPSFATSWDSSAIFSTEWRPVTSTNVKLFTDVPQSLSF